MLAKTQQGRCQQPTTVPNGELVSRGRHQQCCHHDSTTHVNIVYWSQWSVKSTQMITNEMLAELALTSHISRLCAWFNVITLSAVLQATPLDRQETECLHVCKMCIYNFCDWNFADARFASNCLPQRGYSFVKMYMNCCCTSSILATADLVKPITRQRNSANLPVRIRRRLVWS